MARRADQPLSVLALLAAAALGGAAAAVIAACFMWLVESGTELVWTDLPDQLGIAPYESWWMFAVPIVGGVLVGLGQMFLGNHPDAIQKVVATWRAGGHVEPRTMPGTTINALSALITGGPVGFEAALTGLIGGAATLISRRIHAAGRYVRQAFGAERIDSLPHRIHSLPYWLAALAGLVTYRALPFGHIDAGFRFSEWDGSMDTVDALVAFGFAAIVAVPVAWAVLVVARAEEATFFRRSPILVAVAGAVVFAAMAVPSELVLFSGQPGYQQLVDQGGWTLVYLTVAKWAALVVALFAGWRGGPIFPTLFSVGAIAVLVHGPLGVPPQLVMVAGAASVSAVFVRGKIPAAFILTLYVAPLSYAAVILIGAIAGATALALAGGLGILPVTAEPPPPPDEIGPDTDPERVGPPGL